MSEINEPEDTTGEPTDEAMAVEQSSSEQSSSEEMDPDADLISSVRGLIKNGELVSERLEKLLPGVLETAEATNSAADVSRRASSTLETGLQHLQARVNALNEASEKSALLATRVMTGAATAMIIAVFIYGFVAFQLSSRVSQVDAMLVAVSKRVVQMNNALETFEQLRFSINNLAVAQTEMAERQSLMVDAIARSELSTRSLAVNVPDQAAKQVGEKTDQVIKQVTAKTAEVVAQVTRLGQDLESQGKMVSKLSDSLGNVGKQIKSLEGRVSNVQKLNADVEALVTLEREKYLDVLQRQLALDESAQEDEDQAPVEPPKPDFVIFSAKK
ncbi:MAG: hypothetical protein ABS23_07810 [SAR92 bacterium BACL16 MAG-120619-bin48]|jgi:archaellum component FlaC|nr:MAG: hypothetical protein ABS23_07810 [SAR92 bacterium BACL16 MAG-120619-bin48]